MKRIILFLLTNIAILITLNIVFSLLCGALDIDGRLWLAQEGIDYVALMLFAAVFGMGGAFISLLLSATIAKWTTGAHVIDGSEGAHEHRLVETVRRLAERANVGMPQVAVYHGAPNAFATGAFRNHALVAVADGLLDSMDDNQVEAVLGHEMAHVANGDMVTLTLVQGVLNTFVIFFSRAIAFVVDRAAGRDDRRRNGFGLYYIVVWVLDIVLGILASLVVCAFSRRREYAADAGSARFTGSPLKMISALRVLGGLEAGKLPASFRAMGIAASGHHAGWFATHPSIEDRIAALESYTPGS